MFQERSYTTAAYRTNRALRAQKQNFAPARDLPFSFKDLVNQLEDDERERQQQEDENYVAPPTASPAAMKPPLRPYEIKSRGRGLMRLLTEQRTGRTRIIHYDEKTLYEWGVFRHYKGTIFQTWFVWIQQLLLFVIAIVVGAITSPEAAADVDYTALTTISLVVNTLVSFILARFLRRAVLIWWETSHVEFFKLMDTVDAMVLRTAVYFSGKHQEDRAIRFQILRYGLLSVALFFKDARNIDANSSKQREEWEVENLEDLIADGLLTQHELKLLSTEYAFHFAQFMHCRCYLSYNLHYSFACHLCVRPLCVRSHVRSEPLAFNSTPFS